MADQPLHRNRKPWPFWLRLLVALGIVLLVFKAYAGWHWSKRIGSGPGVTFSPTHAYVGWRSVMTLIVNEVQTWTILGFGRHGRAPSVMWHVAYLLATAVPAGIIAIATFAWLTRRFGPDARGDNHSRCRRCRYILNGLSEPRCPECGERI